MSPTPSPKDFEILAQFLRPPSGLNVLQPLIASLFQLVKIILILSAIKYICYPARCWVSICGIYKCMSFACDRMLIKTIMSTRIGPRGFCRTEFFWTAGLRLPLILRMILCLLLYPHLNISCLFGLFLYSFIQCPLNTPFPQNSFFSE